MKLLAVGDSFTYGDELSDIKSAWPYLLGESLGYEVVNLGEPGTGNTSMVRKVLDNYCTADIIVVAWSHYARTEFADDYGIFDIWPGVQNVSFDREIKHRRVLIDYLSRHHNDSYMYNQYLNNVVLLQNFLKNNNKQYLMVDAFGNTEARHLGNVEMHVLVDIKNYVGWPYETMASWASGCLTGKNGHFLEEGHIKVADKLYEHIGNISRNT